jgi:hypothetical protein
VYIAVAEYCYRSDRICTSYSTRLTDALKHTDREADGAHETARHDARQSFRLVRRRVGFRNAGAVRPGHVAAQAVVSVSRSGCLGVVGVETLEHSRVELSFGVPA